VEAVACLLQTLADKNTAGMTAAAEEVRRLADSSSDIRSALLQVCVVPALLQLLQVSFDCSEGKPQTAAACALYSLSGYSKAERRADEAALTAMLAAGAVEHLAAALQAAWQHCGCSPTPSQQQGSRAAPTDDSSKVRTQAAATLQKAAAGVLAVIASQPGGRVAIRRPVGGAIPGLVQLLGSSDPTVVSAALSALCSFTESNTVDDTKALWDAGAASWCS
jgi:hypothetical protein